MKVFVFGGTTEARTLSRRIVRPGLSVTVSVATGYGREEQGEAEGITVLCKRMTAEEMSEALSGHALCIDATHPYATEATRNIKEACEAAGVPYLRLLRDDPEKGRAVNDTYPDEDIHEVNDAKEAAAFLGLVSGNILLTTGTRDLLAFAHLDTARLFVRILPSREGIAACEAAGIPHRNIIAMQGPFSRELNEALIAQYGIVCVVTKDGGPTGGFPEKREAARNTHTKLVVIRRPAEEGMSMDEIADVCGELRE